MPFDFSQVTAPFRIQPGLRRIASGAAQLAPAEPTAAP
jgi:dimethylamine monooxygenase subunit A